MTVTDEGSGEKKIEKKLKRFRIPLRIVTALIIIALLVLGGVQMLARPYDKTRNTYADFVVEEGSDLSAVASDLQEQKFIRSSSDFERLAKITFAKNFKPGTYYISASMNSLQILRTLQSGMTTSKGFTVPPGYTVEQLASALERDGLADRNAFLEAAASPDVAQLDIFGENEEGLKGTDVVEGFLLPGEYTLSADADESMILIMMLDAFSNFYNDDYRARADELGITTRQVLVMASMVEKETSADKERARIAGVIHNRINLGLTPVEELPKKPLCSPSKESIEAVLFPEEHEYTYYVLDPAMDGTHRFTADEAEYETWMAEYKEAVNAAAERENGGEETGEAEEAAETEESGSEQN